MNIFEDRTQRGQDLPSWAIDLRVDSPRHIIPEIVSDWRGDICEDVRRQEFNLVGELVLPGRRVGKIIEKKGSVDPWTEGYPRTATTGFPHILESCLSGGQDWYGGSSNRADLASSDPSGLQYGVYEPENIGRTVSNSMEKMFEIVTLERKYKWRQLTLATGADIVTEHWFEEISRTDLKHYYALVSDMVEEGDEIVHLDKATLPFVLRRALTAGGWIFLGPAVVVAGFFEGQERTANGARGQQKEFRYEVGKIRYGNQVPETETFVMV